MTEIWKASWRGLKVWSRVNILYFTKSEGQKNRLFTWIHCHFSFFFNSCCCYLSDRVGRLADRSEWRCYPCVSRAESWLVFFLGRTSSLLPAWCRMANFWDLNWLLSVFPSQSIIAQKNNHLCTVWITVFYNSEWASSPSAQRCERRSLLWRQRFPFWTGECCRSRAPGREWRSYGGEVLPFGQTPSRSPPRGRLQEQRWRICTSLVKSGRTGDSERSDLRPLLYTFPIVLVSN